MVVYITTNLINGKKYIGKDESNNPNYLGSGLQLSAAFKKYGKQNFIKEILCEGRDRKDLEELEKYFIEYYNAQKSPLFYNIAPGGTGGKLCTDYSYRERAIYEVSLKTFDIINEYKSSREAGKSLNICWKTINAVCSDITKKHTSGNKLFCYKDSYDKKNLQLYFETKIKKEVYLSLRTGVFYFNRKELWLSEFPQYRTFSSFLNMLRKKPNRFVDKFIKTKTNDIQTDCK